ncbi:DinB family protein [Yinghuangia soli]|uniref:DinB family protein n=1 Tax=Yinghuangia soli TaxID=2908204 RepID=A0AA41PWX2_9ACTN|nr:DinB family protein [Yinghuangia soli]MCF2527216.1 DinB family protein [Yinghuangia soli]
MTGTQDTSDMPTRSGERADLLASLDRHRGFLRVTAEGLTDEQAATRSTVSALTVGGLIKHVASTEQRWMAFAVGGAAAMEAEPIDWEGQFVLTEDETLAGVLDAYARVAAATDALVGTLDLDAAHPLPAAPWFEPGAVWTVRRVLLHVIAETAQHAGHADIIRETIDGHRTMG